VYQAPGSAYLVGVWINRIERALSIRLAFFCFLFGLGVGVLVGMAWPAATMPTVWTVAIGSWVAAVFFNTGQMVKCDACSKRVKMGADVCHHCGYSRA
jgi:hypothetical protein